MKKIVASVLFVSLIAGAAYARNAYGRTPAEGKAVMDQAELDTAKFAAGMTTNFVFQSTAGVTGQVWFASGVVTNLDLNIND